MADTGTNTIVWDLVIPTPRSCRRKTGEFVLPEELRVWCGHGALLPTVRTVLASIRRILERSPRTGEHPRRWSLVENRDDAHVYVTSSGDRSHGADLSDAHELCVEQNVIRISAVSTAGVAGALATLFQATLQATFPATVVPETHQPTPAPGTHRAPYLPAVEIVDHPEHQWRGFMFDVARHFFPSDSLDQLLDILWLLKLNRYQLHLTDDQGWRVPIEGYPRLTVIGSVRDDGTSENGTCGGYYSRDELDQLDRTAAHLGIEVIPEIDLPGHASAAITAYPELGCTGRAPGVATRWGIFDAVLCPVGTATERFIDHVFGSVSELFRGDHLHIGGDEVRTSTWHESGLCREFIREHGPSRGLAGVDDLYGVVVRSMVETVLSRGKRPIAWDEASELDLPGETIIANWREPAYAAAALQRGHDIVLVPQGRRAYLDHKHRDTSLEAGRLGVCTVRDSASFEPNRYVREAVYAEPDGSRAGGGRGDTVVSAGRVLGGQANLWTEAIAFHSQAEYMAILRVAAISQGLWSGDPGNDRWDTGFRHALERFRTMMFSRGYNVYPGPLE